MEGAGLTSVLNKLSDLLERQVGLIAGAEDEIRSLRDHLSLLTIFLEGINAQSDRTTPLVDQLVDQLRRVSWKAEDLVDQYILDVGRHERKKYVKKLFTGCGMVSRKGELAKQSQDIKNTIEDILTNKERFGVQLDYGTSSYMTAQQNEKNALDRMRRNVEEENVVGFDQQTCEVMEMLMPKGGVVAKELRVVSIIGMGGLGKSTLARKIFTSMEIEMHFVTKVWVVASEHVEARHVLKNILQYLNVKFLYDDDEYLKRRLKEELDGRRYLIVLDDLWTPKQWEELKSYFPTDQKRGSRILLTSRIENVANVASTISTTYHLRPMGDADSWSLFCKKALKGEECPSDLEAIGKDIVSKCKGLPLAIVVLGGALSAAEAKPSFRYWSKTLGETSWHPDVDNDCSKILLLSYRNLPPHLRTCFLYVGVFPEDFEILAKDLCLLWMAEGFVNQQSRELEEDEAEKYLMNLVDQNLIMISKRKSDGSIKSCRIHDFLRDMCIKEAERCNLYQVGAVGANQNVIEGIRRLTIHKSDHTTLLLPPAYEGIKTFLDFADKGSHSLRSVFKHLSVMRVVKLDVLKDRNNALNWIQNLFLLRYLKVQKFARTNMFDISKFLNLQVLDLMNYDVTKLPKGVWKLKLLRHIYVRDYATMSDAPSSDDSLPYLQTLSCIIYKRHTSKMLCTKRFPNLRKLSVRDLNNDTWRSVNLQSLQQLLHLLTLKIRCNYISGDPFPVGDLFSRSLNVHALPSTLTKIHLNNTALTSAHWMLLGELKNLQILKLSIRDTLSEWNEERFINRPLVFEAEAFPQLLHLKLRTRHPALVLKNGALRSLQYLIIRQRSPQLSSLPERLWLLTTLRQVKVIYTSKALLDYIRSLDNSKRSKVTAIYRNRYY